MKIEYIREFVALGSELNFSAAAERLYISQPALSRHIIDMEEELGQRLLCRDTHSVELTSAGLVAMNFFSNFVEQYDSFLNQIKIIKNGEMGSLILHAPYYATDKLHPYMKRFKELYPKVNILLNLEQPYEVIDDIISRKSDVGLALCYAKDGTDLPEQLRHLVLGPDHWFVGLPANHPLAAKQTIQFSDLNDQVILLPQYDHFLADFLELQLRKKHVIPDRIVYWQHAELVTLDALQKNAIFFNCKHMLKHDSSNKGDIVYRRISDKQFFCYFVLISHSENTNPALKLFWEMAEQLIEK